jgi:hypothetical protein
VKEARDGAIVTELLNDTLGFSVQKDTSYRYLPQTCPHRLSAPPDHDIIRATGPVEEGLFSMRGSIICLLMPTRS